MITLSTHVLDTERGLPAEGVELRLSRQVGENWDRIADGATDLDGRFGDFGELEQGTYRLAFETGDYGNPFYPLVEVVFVVEDSSGHLHVPLLLSRYGYTTYRGS